MKLIPRQAEVYKYNESNYNIATHYFALNLNVLKALLCEK